MHVRPRPSFLDQQVKLSRAGGPRWRSADRERIYEWDSLHGHIEVYDRRGLHRGAADALTGELILPAVKGRRIDV